MMNPYIEEQTFEKVDFTAKPLPKNHYERCTFKDCNFGEADLTGIKFTECEFIGCNLGMVKTTETGFREVRFVGCKLLGIRFDLCDPFLLQMSFEGCTLNFATFYKLGLKKTVFANCTLHEVDFSEADLSAASFDNCDLMGAIFDRTNLEKADLRTAYHYAIDPATNPIKKAQFSQQGLAGLLYKYDIVIE